MNWLDAETGTALGLTNTLLNISNRRSHETSYLSECVGRFENDPEIELLANAWRAVNCKSEANRMFSSKTERTYERDRLRASLGTYWSRRCEIYARLVEQWVATKLGKASSAAGSPEEYQSLPGWWTEEAFQELMLYVENSVERRIVVLQESGVKLAL